LNEEKLCQVLANQTRALQKKRSQAASHVHQLPIKPPQKPASLRVPEMAAQVQTSSQRKMVAEVAQNSALQTPMHHALHAPRVHSLKLVLQRLTAQAATAGLQEMSVAVHQVARLMATAMTELLAKTAADTRVVQSALHTVAMIVRLALVIVTHARHTATAMTVRLAKTAVDTRVVQSVLHTVVQVQLPVVATVVK
jgi:hypothetical protein